MVYKYVNAGLKSKAEAIKRMMDGEVFYFGKDKIFYSEDQQYTSPFIILGDKEARLGPSWSKYREWTIQVECSWYDNLSGGILCWVSNDENDENGWMEKIVLGHDKDFIYPFRTRSSRWKYARPMTKDEISRYTIKE